MFFMPNVVRDLPTMKSVHFPVFEVITPVTGVSFNMRGLTVAQESALRDSLVSLPKRLAMINQTLFECAEDKRPPYDTLEGFERNLTSGDRSALIYGMFVTTHGEEQTYKFRCPRCGKEFDMKLRLSDFIKIKSYEGNENLLEKEVTVVLPVSGYKAVLRMPTLYDERQANLVRNVDKDIVDKMSSYIIVKKLIVPGKEKDPATGETIESEYVIDKTVEIYSTITKLPFSDNKVMFQTWKDNFGKYDVEVEVENTCPDCGNEFKNQLSLYDEFFRLCSTLD